MITDADFWIEIRRKQGGGNELFKAMLSLIHARQSRLDSHIISIDREEYNITRFGKMQRDSVDGKILSLKERQLEESAHKKMEEKLRELEKPLDTNKALHLRGVALCRVASITVRVLQHVMMYAVPIYSLRYNIPAMSMSWNTSCFIDCPTQQLITFGAGQGVKVPQLLHGRGCVAGNGFFAILSDTDEVWASGGLKVSSFAVNGPISLGREDAMIGIAAKTLMLVGHGQQLASVTRAFTVRSLSALSNPTRSIIPSRHVRFLDLGYGDDYYMIGADSVVYKTTVSKRAISTPRRVMTLSRTAVSRVASGAGFLLIIDQNGHLYTLGRNKKGQLGNGKTQDARRKPYLQTSLIHHYFTQVAAGECHSLALTSSGLVYGAGSNESGQLGLNAKVEEALNFTTISLPSKCIGIAAGPAGSMFACEDGRVYTCGLNDCMQLGLDTVAKIVYEPTPIPILLSGVESYTMDFGGYHRSELTESDGVESCATPSGVARNSSYISEAPLPIEVTSVTPFGKRNDELSNEPYLCRGNCNLVCSNTVDFKNNCSERHSGIQNNNFQSARRRYGPETLESHEPHSYKEDDVVSPSVKHEGHSQEVSTDIVKVRDRVSTRIPGSKKESEVSLAPAPAYKIKKQKCGECCALF